MLGLSIIACAGAGVPPTATPLPPTSTVQPTPTKPAPTATAILPTRTPVVKDTAVPATSAPEDLLPLSPNVYNHPSGAFSISIPEGWTAIDYSNSMYAAPATGDFFMAAGFENVGIEFDNPKMESYVSARNLNSWGGFQGYNANKPELQSGGSWVVSDYLVAENGTPMAIVSYSWQRGKILYNTDFGMPYDQFDAYSPIFANVAGTLQVQANAVADAPLYATHKLFKGPNDLFQFEVPVGWAYAHSKSDDGSTVSDTFTSPDEAAAIISLAYDDGTKISKSVAGQFALGLLHDVYKIQGIKVKVDQVQPDGSERLDWTSPSLNGTTFFETRGTTFLLLNWVVDPAASDFYFPLWGAILGTYSVPK